MYSSKIIYEKKSPKSQEKNMISESKIHIQSFLPSDIKILKPL